MKTRDYLETMKQIVDDQIKFGPSESAMIRMEQLLILMERTLDRSTPAFTPGTEAFNRYVFEKINSEKDVKNIASRYGIPREDVLEAYAKGSGVEL